MANILVIDLLEESAYLLRSLIRAKGHAVSIAISEAESVAKLETGLFDVVVADLCEPTETNLGLCMHANNLLPGLPIVALTHEQEQDKIKGIEIFSKILRPIRGAQVNKAVEDAAQYAANLGARRQSNRIEVNIPLHVRIGGESVRARVTDLSQKGFALDAHDKKDPDLESLNRLNEIAPKEVLDVEMQPSKGEKYKLRGRVAFVDPNRRFSGKMIGVVFEELEEETRHYIKTLFAGSVSEEG